MFLELRWNVIFLDLAYRLLHLHRSLPFESRFRADHLHTPPAQKTVTILFFPSQESFDFPRIRGPVFAQCLKFMPKPFGPGPGVGEGRTGGNTNNRKLYIRTAEVFLVFTSQKPFWLVSWLWGARPFVLIAHNTCRSRSEGCGTEHIFAGPWKYLTP